MGPKHLCLPGFPSVTPPVLHSNPGSVPAARGHSLLNLIMGVPLFVGLHEGLRLAAHGVRGGCCRAGAMQEVESCLPCLPEAQSAGL